MTKEQFIAQVEAIQKPLRRFLLALCCGDSQQSDDIAQEAFIKAYLSCDTLSSPEKFNAWIFRIAYNSFLDAKRTLRHTVDYGEASALKSGERADGAFQYQDLYAALNRLPAKERTSVLLFYLQGYSIKEIAEIQTVSADAVKQHLSRGRNHLRALLNTDQRHYGR
ncbi:MAG: RNA polymerase sigma factor [Muribaculaceae bacterium]|jgi:RNA polymerase sigma-70 factor (ECF subfamily)|nr:RNA polymerase sigma factor [Muribaculaceae bacterium]